ncbi:YcjF family protein [Leptolyngbya sp. PCC 6406]|uniref:YcjF family protein n=1 Tax=Leptolyngbya sp. PCC 6406 TaxID=1173264 RepID=UPI0002ACBB68|nr:GTP-binding protein [Leptolyngbya sp. PCC 6406]
MTRLRRLAIALGGLLALGMGLWLVDFIVRVQAALALMSPLLAQIFLLLVGMGAIALFFYGRQFLRPRKSRPVPTLPQETVAATHTALDALSQQVAQIQDQVAREALGQRAQQLSENLAQRDIRVVVFGVGSVGKTALVNRLLGQAVGEVAAPLGSTTIAATYPLRLPGVDQTLWLTDTPGLLEASAEGPGREAQVRQLATEADLLLFVIDDDLRQSEYALTRSLLAMGKRLLVVFNKADLYPEEDLAEILARVRSRFQTALDPEDVVDIAADPQPIPLASGGMTQMDPDLWPLEQRLTAVLRAEGASLMADTILLRSQRLGAEARQLIDRQRREDSDRIVDRYQWISAGVVAATPLPLVDLLATAAINAQMVVELGRVYRCDLSIEEGKTLALTLARTLTSLGIVKGAMNLLAVGMQANLATAIASRAVQGASAAYLTRIAGKSFITYFQQNQDWGDGGIGAVVEQQFQINRREAFIQDFVKTAIDHMERDR